MAYPHKWSPISCKSRVGQRKDTGQRPMLYRWTTQPTYLLMHGAHGARTVRDLKPCECDSGSPTAATVTSRREDPKRLVLASSQVASWTHAGVHLGLADTSRRHTRTICIACLVTRQPRHTADMSTNRRQSFLCCRTTCMEQAAVRPQAAVVERLIL